MAFLRLILFISLLLSHCYSQEHYDGGDYEDYGEDYNDYGDDYGNDYDLNDNLDGYGDYDGNNQAEEKIPGLLTVDEISFRKLLATEKWVIAEFVKESWSSDSERLKYIAREFEENDDVFVSKIVMSESPALVERYSIQTDGEMRLFRGQDSVPVVDTDNENAATFIRSSTDQTIVTLTNRVKGLLHKDPEIQNQILNDIDSIITNESSDLSKKILQFLKVTWKRSGGDIEKIRSERTRTVNLLLQNVENISPDKVVEFRVRVEVMKALDE